MNAPDSAGYWAWEGYTNYAKGANPNRIEREVVRVFWGTSTNTWQVVRVRGDKARHPAYMLVGKWHKLIMPWEANHE